MFFFLILSEVQSIRTGLRKRKREETPQNTEPQVNEEWVDESKLELWEIKLYGERFVQFLQVSNVLFHLDLFSILIRGNCGLIHTLFASTG